MCIALSSNVTTLGMGSRGFLHHPTLRNCIILDHSAASRDSCDSGVTGGPLDHPERQIKGLFSTQDLESECLAVLLKVWVA